MGMAAAVLAGLIASTTPASAAPVRYEAEDAALSQCVVEANDRLRVTIPSDAVRPTPPGQPTCPDTEITPNSVHLHWGASTDNVGVTAYDIYHDGNKISEATGAQTDKNLTGLTPNTEYRLSVFARDAAGNVSDPSAQDVTVNGSLVADELAFPGTGAWTTWQTTTITVPLNAGANTVQAVGTTVTSGPNLDYLEAQL